MVLVEYGDSMTEELKNVPEAAKRTMDKVMELCSHYEGEFVENAGGYTVEFGSTLDYGNWFPRGSCRVNSDGTISNACDRIKYRLESAGLYKEVQIYKEEAGCVSSTHVNIYSPKYKQMLTEGWKVCKNQG